MNSSSYILCCVLSPVSEYVTELTNLLFNEVILDPAPFVAELKKVAVPDFLCSQYERPVKAEAIANHVSRFSCPGGVGTAPTNGNPATVEHYTQFYKI